MAAGFESVASGESAIAIGSQSLASGSSSIALGDGANATGLNDIAIGTGATTLADNAVALGAGSVATDPMTVSVGQPGFERRIVNVAPGIDGTDAVNLSQLNRVKSKVSANTAAIATNAKRLDQHAQAINANSAAIGNNQASIQNLHGQLGVLENRVGDVEKRAYSGVAAATALAHAMAPSAPGKTTFNYGVASYYGEEAVGFSLAHRLQNSQRNHTIFAGVGVTSDRAVYKLGGSVEF
ncbi:MAG: hypothetical protein LJE84_05520 [Gammaproteobacteria bacterium]|nr:hypothetical protein [Gammaproteobacteria bacterium]